MATLPQYVVLKSKYNGKYLEYVEEEGQVHGYLRFTGEDVTSPLSKFEVELSESDSQLVHFRSCYNNKYLASASGSSNWIVSEADKPEEDQSKWSCTLFRPVPLAGGGGDDYRFQHMNTGNYAVLMRMGDGDPKNNCLYPGWVDPNSDLCDVCTVIDWKSLVVLPRYVAFKGDNGNYISGRVYRDVPFPPVHVLQFTTSDVGDETVGHEVFRNPDGSIRLKSIYLGRFWRVGPVGWVSVDVDSDGYMDSLFWPSKIDIDNSMDILFWPVKINDNTIALRSMSNDRFCKRYTEGGMDNGLRANISTISLEARLQVSETVVLRDIHNVEFHLTRARRYNEKVVEMGTGEVVNNDTNASSMDVKVTRTETKSRSWSAGTSLKLGVKTTLKTKVPFVLEGKIELSAEITASFQMGGVETETNTFETVYKAFVPPMTKVTVSAIGTTATCDVPFSYTQTDTYTDGRQHTYRLSDGTYTGINSYNVAYQIKHQPIDPTDT